MCSTRLGSLLPPSFLLSVFCVCHAVWLTFLLSFSYVFCVCDLVLLWSLTSSRCTFLCAPFFRPGYFHPSTRVCVFLCHWSSTPTYSDLITTCPFYAVVIALPCLSLSFCNSFWVYFFPLPSLSVFFCLACLSLNSSSGCFCVSASIWVVFFSSCVCLFVRRLFGLSTSLYDYISTFVDMYPSLSF